MPRKYDPRRYGPSSMAPPANPPWCMANESTPEEAWNINMEKKGNIAVARKSRSSLREQRWGTGISQSLPTQQRARASSAPIANVRQSLEDDIVVALTARPNDFAHEGFGSAASESARGRSIAREGPVGVMHSLNTAGNNEKAGFTTRRRSLSWHHRERLRSSGKGKGKRKKTADGVSRGGAECGRAKDEANCEEGNEKKPELEPELGERIDAEQLFRRKQKFTYHVTFDGWVESYDRSLAERALFERRERLEMKQEEERKRQRAAEEFEKWLWNHARAPVSSTKRGEGDQKRDDEGGAGRDGQRNERAARPYAAAPEYTPYSWREAMVETNKSDGCKARGGGMGENQWNCDGDLNHGGGGGDGDQASKQREKINRAFRKWVGAKKKQAQVEREATRRKEETLEKRRLLEASRRWKKRSVVCAYTYGAKLGARQWSQEDEEQEIK